MSEVFNVDRSDMMHLPLPPKGGRIAASKAGLDSSMKIVTGKLMDAFYHWRAGVVRSSCNSMYDVMSSAFDRYAMTNKRMNRDFELHMQEMTSAAVLQEAAVLDRMKDVYVKLSNSEGAEMVKLGFEHWAQRVRSMKAKDKRKAAVQSAAAKMITGLQGGSIEAAFGCWKAVMARAQAKTDVVNIAAKWQLGEEKGILFSVLRAWQMAWNKFKRSKRYSMAVQSAMMHSFGEEDQADMMTAFLAWHKRLVVKKMGYEADTSIMSLRSDMDEKISKVTKENERLKAVAHNNILTVVKKWLLGDQQGLLASVIQTWRAYTKAIKTQKRASAGMKLQMAKWVEGDVQGLFHQTFSNWHEYVAHIVGARKQKEEVEKQEAMWKGRMDAFQATCDDELDRLKSEAECMKERIHLTVDSVLKNWMLGDDKGLTLSSFSMWAQRLKDKKALMTRKQNVNDSVMRFLLGDQLAAMKMCFRAWATDYKSGARERLEAARELEYQAKWDENELQWLGQHNKAIFRTRVSLIARQMAQQFENYWMSLLRDWRLIVTAAKRHDYLSNSVQMVAHRFLLGESQGALKTIVASWMTWTKVNHERTMARAWQEKKQLMFLEKYFRETSNDRTFKYWASIIKERKDAERENAKKVRDAANHEMERMIDLEDTRRDAIAAKAIVALGSTDGKALKREVFYSWKMGWQNGSLESMYHRAAMHIAAKLLNRDAWKNARVLKEFCWAHWYAHILHKIEAQKKADEQAAWAAQKYDTPVYKLKERAAELKQQLEKISEEVERVAAELRTELNKGLQLTDDVTNSCHHLSGLLSFAL